MTIDENKTLYLIQEEDRYDGTKLLDYLPDPVNVYGFTTITPLIDGINYFSDLETQIDALGGDVTKQRIYISSWWFRKEFVLPSGTTLVEKLKAKALAGADVRVLLWCNDYLLSTRHNFLNEENIFTNRAIGTAFPDDLVYPPSPTDPFWANVTPMVAGYIPVLAENIEGFLALSYTDSSHTESDLFMEGRVMLNTLGYPAGAIHMKFALVIDQLHAVGYTGGMDFVENRYADSDHNNSSNWWHDIQARVEGDAVMEMFTHFRNYWNELITRREDDVANVPTFLFNGKEIMGTPLTATSISDIAPEDFPVYTKGNCYIQSIRTVPHMTKKLSLMTPRKEYDLSFAENGVYELFVAVRKMIANASTYIYIEDQAFWSSVILGYLRDALTSKENLKIILVTGQFDPTDPQEERQTTLYQYLLKGLSEEERDRVAIYVHCRAIIHAKIFIADDSAAIIGSAGMYNRSYFTEIEHSVLFVDSEDGEGTVKAFRKKLWKEHFRINDEESDDVDDIEKALAAWKRGWGVYGGFLMPDQASSDVNLTANMRTIEIENTELSVHLTTEIPNSLTPCSAFLIFGAGGVTEDSADFFDSVSTGDHILSSDIDYIEDDRLPFSSTFDFSGFWLKIIDGTNAGSLRKISLHMGQKISFEEDLPAACDNTSVYIMLASYLQEKKIDENNFGLFEGILFRSFLDVGKL